MRSLDSRTAAQTAAEPQWPVHVASVPASHVYVRHLGPPGNRWTRRLPDPVPRDGRTVRGGWWPPLMLDPQWIRKNQSRFQVFHVHFGFDSLSAEAMEEVIKALRTAGKPLVLTVHDLRNPHQPDRRPHDSHLDLLVPAADELITLTNGAAAEIKKRCPHVHFSGGLLTAYGWDTVLWVSFVPLALAVAAVTLTAAPRPRRAAG